VAEIERVRSLSGGALRRRWQAVPRRPRGRHRRAPLSCSGDPSLHDDFDPVRRCLCIAPWEGYNDGDRGAQRVNPVAIRRGLYFVPR
jgi:hypothetical protein